MLLYGEPSSFKGKLPPPVLVDLINTAPPQSSSSISVVLRPFLHGWCQTPVFGGATAPAPRGVGLLYGRCYNTLCGMPLVSLSGSPRPGCTQPTLSCSHLQLTGGFVEVLLSTCPALRTIPLIFQGRARYTPLFQLPFPRVLFFFSFYLKAMPQ